ncbi:MAG TPA: UDP-glucose 4-epimerase GalE [Bacteroidia bacterium]|jgi:UDP-glucose 4-epimerase
MDSAKKVLVTGGAGYIGSHVLIELLADKNAEVISADNFSNSTPGVFDRLKQITGKEVRNYNVNLCDAVRTNDIFEKEKNIEAIMHFAAYKSVPDSVADPEKYFNNNNGSLRNMLDAAKKHGVKYFIFSSSCSVYGNISRLPVNELTPIGMAESPYAQTKQDGEQMLQRFAKQNHDVKCISLRYFNPVGAHPSGLNGESPLNPPQNLVPVITGVAIGRIKELLVHGSDYNTRDGTCIRDYIHVCDIAAAHVKALQFMEKENSGENHFLVNLGSGEGVSVLEAIKAFEKVSGLKLNYRIGPRRAGDVEAIYSDCSTAEKLLGWKPRYSIEDMMSTAWKWEQERSRS